MKYQDAPEEDKQRARDELLSGGYPYHGWWDGVYEDAKAIGALMGITIDEIRFSGFWSQGDGASFRGTYDGVLDASTKVREHATEDAELRAIADSLTALQTKRRLQYGSTVCCHVTYAAYSRCHSGTMITTMTNLTIGDEESWVSEHHEQDDADLQQCMRAFADWIYKKLEQKHEYLTSDEQLDEVLADTEIEDSATI